MILSSEDPSDNVFITYFILIILGFMTLLRIWLYGRLHIRVFWGNLAENPFDKSTNFIYPFCQAFIISFYHNFHSISSFKKNKKIIATTQKNLFAKLIEK
jgi:hypothetical protein